MAAPQLAGVLSSSAGLRATAVEAIRATSPGPSAVPASTGLSFGGLHGGLFAGMVVGILFLMYWYRRIL